MQPLENEHKDIIILITRDDERRTVRGTFKPQAAFETLIDDRLTMVSRAMVLVQHSKLTDGLTSSWTAEVNGKRYDIDGVMQHPIDKTYELTLRGYA